MKAKAGTQTKNILFFIYACYFINGMLALSIGSLLPFIRDSRSLTYTQAGMLVSLHAVGNIFSSFFSGVLAGIIGRKRTALLFEMFFPTAFILMFAGHGFFMTCIAFLMTGLARGANTHHCNAAVNDIAPGEAYLISRLHGIFSIGAFLLPLFVALITGRSAGNWGIVCFFMAGTGFLNLLLLAVCPGIERNNEGQDEAKPDNRSLAFFRNSTFLLILAVLFFYVCAESSIMGWMVTYFTDTGYISARLSQVTSSSMWLMMMTGRFLTSYLSKTIDKRKLLVSMGLGMLFFFVLTLFAKSAVPVVICIMGVGLFMAGISPTVYAFAGKITNRYPLAWSVLLTIGGLGSVIMPAIVGRISEASGIALGISSIAAVVVIDLICIFALCRRDA